jgi:hypothetical protein
MHEQCHIKELEPIPWYTIPCVSIKYGQLMLPWHLPTGYSQAIRDIMDGTSNIFFTGDIGELWDRDAFFLERKDWTLEQWDDEWNEKVLVVGIRTDF